MERGWPVVWSEPARLRSWIEKSWERDPRQQRARERANENKKDVRLPRRRKLRIKLGSRQLMSPQSEMDEWAERRRMERVRARERERETSLDHWACVLDTWFARVRMFVHWFDCLQRRWKIVLRFALAVERPIFIAGNECSRDFQTFFSEERFDGNVWKSENSWKRIEQFRLVWVLMRKRSNLWDEKRVFFWEHF